MDKFWHSRHEGTCSTGGQSVDTKFVWESVSRSRRPLGEESYVSFRKCSIKVSAGFDKAARIKEQNFKYVSVRRDSSHRAILLHFLSENDLAKIRIQNPFVDGIFAYGGDGGGKVRQAQNRGGVIACGAVIKNTPWIKEIVDSPTDSRSRFAPEAGSLPNQWILRLVPHFSFSNDAKFCDAPAGMKGIYCYEALQGEILYIGQGHIKARYNMHKKEKRIQAALFRWSPVEDESLRLHAEAHHLDKFHAQHGRLPRYNVSPPAAKSKKR